MAGTGEMQKQPATQANLLHMKTLWSEDYRYEVEQSEKTGKRNMR